MDGGRQPPYAILTPISYPVVPPRPVALRLGALAVDTSDFFYQCRNVILLYATVAPLNGLRTCWEPSRARTASSVTAALLSPKNWLDQAIQRG